MSSEIFRTVECSAAFDCELRIWNRAEFQKQGRMLCNLYAQSSDSSKRITRPWEGDKVYDLRLIGTHGVYTNPKTGDALHRVISDSLEDAQRLMGEMLRNQVFAWARAEVCQQFDRDQFSEILKERSQIGTFIQHHYQPEIAAGKHEGKSLVDVLVYYLSKERNRWSVKLARIFSRRKEK